MALSPDCQSAQMSKITNDDLNPSGTGCFIAVPDGNSGHQRLNVKWCTARRSSRNEAEWHRDCMTGVLADSSD